MHFTDPKDQRIKQLENENKKQQDMIKRLQDNGESLTQAILHAAKKRYGHQVKKRSQLSSIQFGEKIVVIELSLKMLPL